jgi:hypothetical protein
MAIDTWIRVTLDPAASKKPDNQGHQNNTSGAGSDGGSLTIAYDSAVITNSSLANSCIESAKRAILGRLPQ